MAQSRAAKAQAAKKKAKATPFRSTARGSPQVTKAVAKLADRVRQLRRAKGLTQEELGWSGGIDPKHVAAVERGATNPTLSTLLGIAKALGVTLSELLEGVGP